MSLNILLPDASELEVKVTIPNKEKGVTDTLTLSIFDIENWCVEASSIGGENQTSWSEEFPAVFKKETGCNISVPQSILLYDAIREQLSKVKKNLLVDSSPSEKPATSQSRKKRKK